LSAGPSSAELLAVTATAPAPDFAAATVLDPEGCEVALDSLWKDRPVVLAFVRHFG